jgi:hypothetical protein
LYSRLCHQRSKDFGEVASAPALPGDALLKTDDRFAAVV